jgi:hypothetical protein
MRHGYHASLKRGMVLVSQMVVGCMMGGGFEVKSDMN